MVFIFTGVIILLNYPNHSRLNQFFTLVVSGLPLVGVCLLVFVFVSCSSSDESFNINLEQILGDQPIFKSQSKEAVLLRYKFKTGKSYSSDVVFFMNTVSKQGRRTQSNQTLMNMQVKYRVKSQSEAKISNIEMLISRLKMTSKGLKKINYDSARDKSNKKPEFAVFNAIVGTPIDLKIDDRGKVLSVSLLKIEEKIKKTGNKIVLQHLQRTAKELTLNSFIALPKKSIRAGERIKVGGVKTPLPNVGQVKMDTEYKVIAVSGDKKKVILQPLVKYTIEPSKQSKLPMKINKANMKAWILFSIEKGDVLKSSAKINMSVSSLIGNSRIDTQFETAVSYTNHL